MNIVMSPLELSLIGAVVLLTISLMSVAVIFRRRMHQLRAAHEQILERHHQLDQTVTALLSCSRRIGDRIGSRERAERTLQKQIDRIQISRDDGQLAVEHAMKLLERGTEMAEVARICDLSDGEIEILQNLARFRNVA